ncbi:MAG: hypothetical protein IKB34_07485, partial [Clostridia bacterium]|nr:hypothetical protein [Clostridia bacterium]
MKRNNLKVKILSFAVTLVFLFNIFAMPLELTVAAADGILSTVGKSPPTAVPDEIETVKKNPHDIEVSVEAYPILNSSRYKTLNIFGNTKSVRSRFVRNEGISPYFTASLGVWYDHTGIYSVRNTSLVESELPYRDEREWLFHPELKITDTTLEVRLDPIYKNPNGYSAKDIMSPYLTEVLGLNTDQLTLRIGATMLSGYGQIEMRGRVYSERLVTSIDSTKRTHMDGYLDVPYSKLLNGFDLISFMALPNYIGDYSTAVMTGMHFVLIDDTSPTVAKSSIVRYDNADGTGDLELKLTMNEGLRFSSAEAKDRLDDIWVEVEVYNLKSKNRSTARLHLKELNGKDMTFRGNIGYYNYNDFRVTRISKVNIPSGNAPYDSAIVDSVDGLCVSSYEVEKYGNSYYNSSQVEGPSNFDSHYTTLICDHAGNPIQTAAITNWTLGDQSFIKNTFEAVKVELYADTAYAKLLVEPDPKLNASDLFVGPANNLSAFVY